MSLQGGPRDDFRVRFNLTATFLFGRLDWVFVVRSLHLKYWSPAALQRRPQQR